jgi:hypothetical protein
VMRVKLVQSANAKDAISNVPSLTVYAPLIDVLA